MAIDMPAQRLEIGDVVLIRLPNENEPVEAKVVRQIERTPDTVRASVRVGGADAFVQEWRVGELVTVVRGP